MLEKRAAAWRDAQRGSDLVLCVRVPQVHHAQHVQALQSDTASDLRWGERLDPNAVRPAIE